MEYLYVSESSMLWMYDSGAGDKAAMTTKQKWRCWRGAQGGSALGPRLELCLELS